MPALGLRTQGCSRLGMLGKPAPEDVVSETCLWELDTSEPHLVVESHSRREGKMNSLGCDQPRRCAHDNRQ